MKEYLDLKYDLYREVDTIKAMKWDEEIQKGVDMLEYKNNLRKQQKRKIWNELGL